MILVTVGTTYYDELVQAVDRLAGAGEIAGPVLAQIGEGKYVPSHIQWVRYVPDLKDYFRKADLVICHGGGGTVLELLHMGKAFIAVPNRVLQHDHQSDLLRALEAEHWCVACYDLAKLGSVIKNRPVPRPYPADPELPGAVWDFLLSGGRRTR
jgi:beta-1,4-N-acetylglucosaminyltransferase